VAWLLMGFSLCAQVKPSPTITQLKQDAAKAQADGNTETALRLYRQILAKTSEWADGWWEYGNLLYDSRRFAEAAQAFGRLSRLAPENPLGFALLGLSEYEEGDWNNASLHLNKALSARNGMPAPRSATPARPNGKNW